jgi:mannitol-1-phosphate 5-dehydrogenase
METFVQIGAGNIGRSFVGQLFSRAGFEVVFVDVYEPVIAALNQQGRYRVEVKDICTETLWVENVRGVSGSEGEAVVRELTECRLCATSVGVKALPHVLPAVAEAIVQRRESGRPPLDIILAENLREAAAFVSGELARLVPPDFPLAESVGLVETSIGKMVPIMNEADRAADPLLVFAEAYNNLICDARGFRNPLPAVPGLDPKENIAAYVDRKSFIHNLGHALCAYLGHIEDPSLVYTWQTVAHPVVGAAVRAGMRESGQALIRQYPDEFDEANQQAHIEDLLRRFANEALGDTLQRVGRDLGRKLSREDRVIGALLNDLVQGVEPRMTALCAAAGMHFAATDEQGEVFPPDRQILFEVAINGVDQALIKFCGLRVGETLDDEARELISAANRHIVSCQLKGRSVLENY